MAETFGVAPSGLRGTRKRLDDVRNRMLGMLSSLRDNLAGEGAPWEGGELGEQFARDFVAQLEWVGESVAAKTGLLDHYARGLKRAADSFEHHDEG